MSNWTADDRERIDNMPQLIHRKIAFRISVAMPLAEIFISDFTYFSVVGRGPSIYYVSTSSDF